MTHRMTRSVRRRIRAGASLAAAAAFAVAGAAARGQVPPTYTFSYAGLSPSAPYGFATGINDAGQVIIDAQVTSEQAANGQYVGQLYNGSGPSIGSLTQLPLLPGGKFNVPNAINAAGVIVGCAGTSVTTPVTGYRTFHSYAYNSSTGVMTDLPTLGGYYGAANAINATGTIVGNSTSDKTDAGNGIYNAFVIPGDGPNKGAIAALPGLGGPQSHATGVNDAGVICGDADTTATTTDNEVGHAVTWTNNVLTDLGTLGGSYSGATAINNAGQAVGYSTLAGDTVEDAVLFANGTITPLGDLGGGASYAGAISNNGEIVGESFTAAQAAAGYNQGLATLFEGSVAYDLNALTTGIPAGWIMGYASGVNDAGQIVGVANDPAGVYHAFLLTPTAVPEPAAIGTLGLAAAAGLACRRRRRA